MNILLSDIKKFARTGLGVIEENMKWCETCQMMVPHKLIDINPFRGDIWQCLYCFNEMDMDDWARCSVCGYSFEKDMEGPSEIVLQSHHECCHCIDDDSDYQTINYGNYAEYLGFMMTGHSGTVECGCPKILCTTTPWIGPTTSWQDYEGEWSGATTARCPVCGTENQLEW